ncbi:unnamed protein product [Periconia digitata]|uniref:YDG domain-containing protein n=1 Tax=Periconia digitata TaxID=1303443 RepID=A0A9W4UHA6_9PLEO|nr:unnamed protein product [Periconia digitata]
MSFSHDSNVVLSSTHPSDVWTSSQGVSTNDLSRARLRRMSVWIRDDLDPIVARDGPESLLSDDVLSLHDFFRSLQTSTKITALDLRSTGIHKAILEITGIATRWPGRLCDDCDNIIEIWSAKFGKLENLHPFLYGRGGCLEGIASGGELSKKALLTRWKHDCPDKIAPGVSHRIGDLGFRAGSWWINPLFAWHAGIMDFDTIEGGVCYDKDNAYALFLKDSGELEAPTETHFTYRCEHVDGGTFRLTAATARTRNPIRVLRSHILNSIWGPKAGVRYEGLYHVIGWSIHKKKAIDNAQQENLSKNLLYDIHFERVDSTPMEEVLRVPTSFQVDEFSEYKRLRTTHRETQRIRNAHPDPEQRNFQYTATKVAPQIAASVRTANSGFGSSYSRTPIQQSWDNSRITTMQRSPMPGGSITSSANASKGPSIHAAPSSSTGHGDAIRALSRSDFATEPRRDYQQATAKTLTSLASSIYTMQSHESNLREVTPWMDYDPQFALPLSEAAPPIRHVRRVAVQPAAKSSQSPPSSKGTTSPGIKSKAKSGSSIKDKIRPSNTAHTTTHLDGSEDLMDDDGIFDIEQSPRADTMSPRYPRSTGQSGGRTISSFIAVSPSKYHQPMSRLKTFFRERRDAISPIVSPIDFRSPPNDDTIHQHRPSLEEPSEVMVDFKDPFTLPSDGQEEE